MNYKIKREISPDELYHVKEGEEREDHKYIARVLLKKVNVGGKKKNRYRYFYDKKSYQAYLNSKKSKDLKSKTSEGNLLEKTKSGIEKGRNLINSFLKKNTNKKVEELGSSYDSNKDIKDAVTLLIGGVIGYTVKELLRKKVEEPVVVKPVIKSKPKDEPVPKTMFEPKNKPNSKLMFVPKYVPKPKNIKPVPKPSQIKKMTDDLKNEHEINKFIKNHKSTLAAGIIKLPNGAYKCFDNQDEYDSYHERLKYQQNEPDFMKQVPDISENDVFTAMEDMSKVNELYDPYDDKYSTNCGNCSAAYELRRRGYDVEAKPRDDSYNGSNTRYYDYFENAEVIGIYGDGTTLILDEYANRVCSYEMDIMDVPFKKKTDTYDETFDFMLDTSGITYTPESIEKAIKQHNPPGSRGMMGVSWNYGGAHSIVYEVDSKGEVIIRDSQTYDEYSLDELANEVCSVRIVRTDDLELKEGILDTVKMNDDKERTYYMDKDKIYHY